MKVFFVGDSQNIQYYYLQEWIWNRFLEIDPSSHEQWLFVLYHKGEYKQLSFDEMKSYIFHAKVNKYKKVVFPEESIEELVILNDNKYDKKIFPVAQNIKYHSHNFVSIAIEANDFRDRFSVTETITFFSYSRDKCKKIFVPCKIEDVIQMIRLQYSNIIYFLENYENLRFIIDFHSKHQILLREIQELEKVLIAQCIPFENVKLQTPCYVKDLEYEDRIEAVHDLLLKKEQMLKSDPLLIQDAINYLFDCSSPTPIPIPTPNSIVDDKIKKHSVIRISKRYYCFYHNKQKITYYDRVKDKWIPLFVIEQPHLSAKLLQNICLIENEDDSNSGNEDSSNSGNEYYYLVLENSLEAYEHNKRIINEYLQLEGDVTLWLCTMCFVLENSNINTKRIQEFLRVELNTRTIPLCLSHDTFELQTEVFVSIALYNCVFSNDIYGFNHRYNTFKYYYCVGLYMLQLLEIAEVLNSFNYETKIMNQQTKQKVFMTLYDKSFDEIVKDIFICNMDHFILNYEDSLSSHVEKTIFLDTTNPPDYEYTIADIYHILAEDIQEIIESICSFMNRKPFKYNHTSHFINVSEEIPVVIDKETAKPIYLKKDVIDYKCSPGRFLPMYKYFVEYIKKKKEFPTRLKLIRFMYDKVRYRFPYDVPQTLPSNVEQDTIDVIKSYEEAGFDKKYFKTRNNIREFLKKNH